MRLIVSVIAGLATLVLWGTTSAGTEPVPDRATGIWSVAECGGDSLTIIVNPRGALLVEAREGKSHVAVATAEWIDDDDSIILTTEGDHGELMLPPMESLERCDSAPASLALMFAETISVFKRFDEIDEHCRGGEGITFRCVASAFDMIDITGDGVFSRAEISRAIRAASFFLGYHFATDGRPGAFVPLEELYLVQVAASAFGPLVATNLIDSYDFDGDGFLSLDELMQDRVPEEGFEGVAMTLLGEASPAMVSTLIETLSGAFDLFGLK